jgi:hypothetical protein
MHSEAKSEQIHAKEAQVAHAAQDVLVLPSRYTAKTVVLPPGQNSSMSSALLGQMGGGLAAAAGASLGIKNPADVYVSLLKSRSVEDSVVQRFGLMARYHAKKQSSARAALEGHVKVALARSWPSRSIVCSAVPIYN